MASFEIAVAKTLVREGGDKITNDPNDKGGLTRFGISQKAYPELDIKNLTEEDAKIIYYNYYWKKVCGNDINNQVIAESIFDFAVNVGVSAASKIAQQAVGAKADGVIGLATLDSLNATSPYHFLRNFALYKIIYYRDICMRDKTQSRYLLGWINRALEGIE